MEIFDLPSEHIVFPKIFALLTIKELIRLGRTCKSFYELTSAYFQVCPKFDFSAIGSKLSKQHLAHLTNGNSTIRHLNLANCRTWLDDDVVLPIVRLNELVLFRVPDCSGVSNAVVQSLAQQSSRLRELSFEHCRWLSSPALIQVGISCHRLRHINLTGCWNLEDESVKILATSNTCLEYINISECYSLTNSSVVCIAKHCRLLQFLGIRGCWRVTDIAVKIVHEYCPDIQTLLVKDCRDITEGSLATLRVKGVNIDVDKPRYLPGQYNHLLHHLQNLQPPRRLNVQI